MNNKQIAKKNMYDKVRKFLDENGSIWATFTPLVDAVTRFMNKNNALQEFMEKQAQSTKGITADKAGKFKKAVDLAVRLARKARAWAHTTGNITLEQKFNLRADDFLHKADNEAITDLENLINTFNAHLTDLATYNITATDMLSLKNLVDDFILVKAAPGNAEAEKIVGTEGIEYYIHQIDEALETIDDLFINEYIDTHGEEVALYVADRRIDTVGVHHTRLDAHITYADGSGNAEGITMHVIELDKKAVSDIDGNAHGPNMKAGTYHVEFTAPNIVTKTIIQKVKSGTTVHLEITVEKQ